MLPRQQRRMEAILSSFRKGPAPAAPPEASLQAERQTHIKVNASPVEGPASQDAAQTVQDSRLPAISFMLQDLGLPSSGEGISYQDVVKQLESGHSNFVIGASTVDEKARIFSADCTRLRQRLAAEQRGLLDPRSKRIQYWDMTTMGALFFTATVTPFEVCLAIPTQLGVLWAFNLVVNAVFAVDIVVQFFLPIVDQKNGTVIRSHRVLAHRYCTSWFLIDFFTVLPFDSLTLAVPQLRASDSACGSSGTVFLKGIKLLRVLRLVKIARVLRASRIIQRWESSLSISTSTRQLISAVGGFVLLFHWLACAWALLPQLMPALREEPGLAEALRARIAAGDASCSVCLCDSDPASEPCRNPCLTSCEMEELAALRNVSTDLVHNSEVWMCRAVNAGYLHPDFETRPASTWLTSLLVAMLQLLGGMGVITPGNDAETVLFVFAIVVGTFVFAAVQGIVLTVFTTGNPELMRFRQDLDSLNYMMKDMRIPQNVRVRVRDYFLRTKHLRKRESYFVLLGGCLSQELQGDLRYLISYTVFRSVWWLAGCEPEFLQTLSNNMTRLAFARDEIISSVDEDNEPRLCVLSQGLASRLGAILTTGAWWGDLLITSPVLRDTRPARSLGYCEIVTLKRYHLYQVLKDYPVSAGCARCHASPWKWTPECIPHSSPCAQLAFYHPGSALWLLHTQPLAQSRKLLSDTSRRARLSFAQTSDRRGFVSPQGARQSSSPSL